MLLTRCVCHKLLPNLLDTHNQQLNATGGFNNAIIICEHFPSGMGQTANCRHNTTDLLSTLHLKWEHNQFSTENK